MKDSLPDYVTESRLLHFLRRKVIKYLFQWSGLDEVLKRRGIDDVEKHYDELVKKLLERKRQRLENGDDEVQAAAHF